MSIFGCWRLPLGCLLILISAMIMNFFRQDCPPRLGLLVQARLKHCQPCLSKVSRGSVILYSKVRWARIIIYITYFFLAIIFVVNVCNIGCWCPGNKYLLTHSLTLSKESSSSMIFKHTIWWQIMLFVYFIDCLCLQCWLLVSDKFKIYLCNLQHNFAKLFTNDRTEAVKRDVLKKLVRQTLASYFLCALSQKMYFSSVKGILNVFLLCQANSKCFSKCIFPQQIGFEMYRQMYFLPVMQFPFHRYSAACWLPAAASVWQALVLQFAKTEYSAQSDLSKNKRLGSRPGS